MGKLTTKSVRRLHNSPLFQGRGDSAAATPLIVYDKSPPFPPPFTPPQANIYVDSKSRSAAATTKPKTRRSFPQSRERRRVEKDRRVNFEAAARFAYHMGWPLNLAITINWTALIQAGERNHGNCLGRDEVGREAYLRSELSRCRPQTACRAPFVAIWGRDIGNQMGSHTHLAIHFSLQLPKHLFKLIAMLERICGSSVAPAEESRDRKVLAESGCKGWQIKFIYGRNLLSGALAWVDYIARQSENHAVWPDLEGKVFGISQAIGPAARAAAQWRAD